ncbi:MAG: TonB-dependent receptor [Rhodocyclaceae bacterium]
MNRVRVVFLRPAWLGMALSLLAQGAFGQSDVLDLSLEELLNVEVTTASRKSQRLQEVAAAVFVIAREDIERSGATSIPDALALAPGVQVARLGNNRWAVSVRGFNGRFGNKLLVLRDGRSIYSPLISGVFWEAEDTLLEDVQRIEVIRGPGAAMWGANAVNGVINIIMRKPVDAQGNLVVGTFGTEVGAVAAIRHGGKVGDGHYRMWAKHTSRNESVDMAGNRGNDALRSERAGFRAEWPLASGNRLMMTGVAYSGDSEDRWNVPDVTSPRGFTLANVSQAASGASLVGRHEWRFVDGSEAAWQANIDHKELKIEGALHERRTTFETEFQHRTRVGESQDLMWGVGYRHSRDHIASQGAIGILPASRNFVLSSAFLHDEISLVPDTLRLTLGARLEHNSFTGFEPQANIRLAWTPTPVQTIWGAVSRAVRTPSRRELDAQIDFAAATTDAAGNRLPMPFLIRIAPNQDHKLHSEKLTGLDLGYRHQLGHDLYLDLAAYEYRYDDLRSLGLGAFQFVNSATPYLALDWVTNNDAEARTRGLEVALDWSPATWWRLQSNYSYLRTSVRATTDDEANRNMALGFERSAPRHQFSLRSSMSFAGWKHFDVWLRHASPAGVREFGTRIPAYTTLDLRYAWRPVPGLELSLVGQNLLDRRHPEIVPDLLPSERLQIERGFYVKAKWQF